MGIYDFNAAVKPISLRDLNAQYLEDEQRRQSIARGKQEQQEGTIRLSQLGQQQKDQQALRDAYGKAAQAGTSAQVQQPGMTFGDQRAPGATSTVKGPGFDRNIMLSELGKTAPHLVPQAQQQFAAEDAAQAKAGLEQQQLKYALAHQQASDIADAYGTVKDQASYDAANAYLKQHGNHGVDQAPPQYDPNWVNSHIQVVVPAIKKIELAQKDTEDKLAAIKAAEDARHNKADEANTVRGQNTTAATAKRGQDMQYGSFSTTIPSGVTGAAALMQMPPAEASAVQAIADGKIDFATMTSRMPPGVKANLAAKILAYKPDYDQRNFGAGKVAMDTVAKGEVPTKIGDQKVAFNTAIAHADLLQQAADALKNGDQQTLNSLKNRFGNEFGEAGPVTAQAIANAYGREVTKMLSGGHLTDSEIGSTGKTIDPNSQSPAQLKSVIGAYRALSKSKLDQLNKQESDALNRGKGAGSGDHHVIQVGAKQYQYKGSGDTADLSNYTEIGK